MSQQEMIDRHERSDLDEVLNIEASSSFCLRSSAAPEVSGVAGRAGLIDDWPRMNADLKAWQKLIDRDEGSENGEVLNFEAAFRFHLRSSAAPDVSA
jgi:hypothetical protein